MNQNTKKIGSQIISLLDTITSSDFNDFNRTSKIAINVAYNTKYTKCSGFLAMKTLISPAFKSNKWTTYKGALGIDKPVKKGEKASQTFYFAPFVIEPNGKTISLKSALKKYKKEHSKELESLGCKIAFSLKMLNVFNVAQLEGFEEEKEEFKTLSIDNLLSQFPIEIKDTGKACYIPKMDKVIMPTLKSFDSEQHFTKTMFHELVHYTGHKTRLDRLEDGAIFGSKAYAKEELTAELGALLLCMHFGIESQIKSTAGYVKSFLASSFKKEHWEVEIFNALQRSDKSLDYLIPLLENQLTEMVA